MYDQGHVVYRPAQMSADDLRIGLGGAYASFYSTSSIASRFPLRGKRHRAQWLIYNLFMRKASQSENIDSIAAANTGVRRCSDASYPARQARMACGCA